MQARGKIKPNPDRNAAVVAVSFLLLLPSRDYTELPFYEVEW